jgi:TolB protein
MLLLFFPAAGDAVQNYIEINSPSLRKIPIAVPLLRAESAGEAGISRVTADLISEYLEFTGFFKMLDRGAFLEEPQKSGIRLEEINFRNWTMIGAELLIVGAFQEQGEQLQVDLWLYDAFKERPLVGKRYSNATREKEDLRKIARKFSGEVIFHLTGNRGIFDSKIAFVSTGTGNKEIYTCEFDGANPKQLTTMKSIALSPAWSHDGNWLAYTGYAKGKPDLYIRHLKDNRGTVVAHPGLNISPAWMPGELSLAATLSYQGDPDIYLLGSDGKVIKKLTDQPGIDVSPSWSPDGKKMAFVSNRSGNPQIHVMDVRSGKVERLTFQGRYNSTPSWSPRGDRIAFSGKEDGNFNIFSIGADGKGLIQLTHNSGDNESPTWSPDGSLIAYSSTREGVSRIYVMNAFGTDQRRLFTLPGEQSNPKWSPSLSGD